ncbi:MAG TPA: UPF0149 family protein [Mesorhizobium sp.]|jgi:uncharacterized protein|nr:UPF0149 family protein [Mesorhizobium sp.]
MPDPSSYLDELDQALLDLPESAMLLSELDGYLTGIWVCPELITPSAWLPPIWNAHQDEDDEGLPVFATAEQAQAVVSLVMEHYNQIGRSLRRGPGHYEPVLETDTRTNETLWELWAAGFEQALALRPDSWTAVTKSHDAHAVEALTGLLDLVDLATREGGGEDQAASDELTATAPDLIPGWVEALHAWRAKHDSGSASTRAAPQGKVGRNDPCPCGSGKKYKKCCGLN